MERGSFSKAVRREFHKERCDGLSARGYTLIDLVEEMKVEVVDRFSAVKGYNDLFTH